jgi:O-acetylserine/cysteine efflux transporter
LEDFSGVSSIPAPCADPSYIQNENSKTFEEPAENKSSSFKGPTLKIRELLLALSVPLIWGFGFTFAKAGMTEFPPLLLMGMRFCIVALILVWFVPCPRGHLRYIFWVALISSTLQYGLTFTGLSMIDASLAVIIVHLEVPFGVLLAVIILRERPGLQRIVGMLLSFSGIVLIAGQPSLDDQIFAIFLTGGGAMVWAVGQLMVKRLGTAVGSFSLVAWVSVFSGPQMILASYLIEDGQWLAIQQASWIGWGTVVYLAFVMTILGYGIWYRVLSRNPMSQVMPVLLLLPVVTIVSSILLLGERPTPTVLAGGVVVLAGVSIIVFTRDSFRWKRDMA